MSRIIAIFRAFCFLLALDQTPSCRELLHINQIEDDVNLPRGGNPAVTLLPNRSAEKAQPPVYITSGLPIIPSKLVNRVQEGHFADIDMA